MKVIAKTIGLEAHPGLPASGSNLSEEVQKRDPYPSLTPRGYQYIQEIPVTIDV